MPAASSTDPAAAFARQQTRHEPRRHVGVVVAVERLSPAMLRVTLGGDDIADLVTTGPEDHARVFFPAGDGEGTVHRDFTPVPLAGPLPGLALDFALHPDAGPASTWALAARPGTTLELGGPRGSRGLPVGARRLVLVGDETALPAISRWVHDAPDDVPVLVLAILRDPVDATYLPLSRSLTVEVHGDALGVVSALGTPGVIDATTFVFAAGEAGDMRTVRRLLRTDLGLPPEQAAVHGYWRRGASGYDHHEPLDPDDPSDARR